MTPVHEKALGPSTCELPVGASRAWEEVLQLFGFSEGETESGRVLEVKSG